MTQKTTATPQMLIKQDAVAVSARSNNNHQNPHFLRDSSSRDGNCSSAFFNYHDQQPKNGETVKQNQNINNIFVVAPDRDQESSIQSKTFDAQIQQQNDQQ